MALTVELIRGKKFAFYSMPSQHMPTSSAQIHSSGEMHQRPKLGAALFPGNAAWLFS